MRHLVASVFVVALAGSVLAQEGAPYFRLGYGGIGAPVDAEVVLDLQPATLPTAFVDEVWDFDFRDQLAVVGDPGALTWRMDVSGAGMSQPIDIDDLSSAGVLSGIALQPGLHSFAISVEGANGGADTEVYSLEIEAEVPDVAFSIPDVVDAMPEALIVSSDVSPSGVLVPSTLSATNGAQVSVEGAGWTTSTTIDVGQDFRVRMAAGEEPNAVVTTEVRIGATASDVWSVTTIDEMVVTLSAGATDVVLEDLFGTEVWESTRAKRVVVPQGVIVESSSRTTPALRTGIGANAGGRVVVQIDGHIHGHGGLGGSSIPASRNGGPALSLDEDGIVVTMSGTGRIYGGGGAGGPGGTGGGGSYYGAEVNREPATGDYYETAYRWREHLTNGSKLLTWNGGNVSMPGATSDSFDYIDYRYYRGAYVADVGNYREYRIHRFQLQQTSTAGGVGGAGGQGAGSNGGAHYGSDGNPGGINAGLGGRGGDGGQLGLPGAAGATGESGTRANGQTLSGANGAAGGQPGRAIMGTPAAGSTIGFTLGS